MLKKIALGLVVLVVAGTGFIAIKFLIPLQASADRNGPDTAPRDYAMQDDSQVSLPAPRAAVYQAAPNPDLNLYWGE